MKTPALLIFSSLLLPSLAALPPAAFERGGVTFDFTKCSDRRFGDVDRSQDLLKEEVSGKLPDGANRTEWNRIKVWPIPVATGQLYRVSMKYRKGPHPAADVGMQTQFHLRPWQWREDLKRHETVDNYASDRAVVIPATRGEWSVTSLVVPMTPGATHLIVQIRRCSQDSAPIEYKDLTIVPELPKGDLEISPSVAGLLDGRFVLGEGQASELEYFVRKKVDGTFDYGELLFTYEVPAGVELMDATAIQPGSLKRTANADGSSTVSFVPKPGTRLNKDYNSGLPVAVLLRATGREGVCGALKLRVAIGGVEKVGGESRSTKEGFSFEAEPIQIEIGPAVKAKAVPKVYANGVSFCNGLRNLTQAGMEAFSDTMTDAGVTWMLPHGTSHSIYPHWREHGVKYITPYAEFANGFFIIPPGGWPLNERWMMKKNQEMFLHYDYLERSPCPVMVYSESETFVKKMVPEILKFSEGADGVWSNWEPWMYRGKGCFCDRCCHAFAAYVGRPYEEIKEVWPACVMEGGAYYDRVQKFRSIEHGKVVKTLDKYVTQGTGGAKSLGFIPGICYIEMGSWWRPRNYAAEVQAIDYADKLKWMNPWGPYASWDAYTPYVYCKRGPLCHFLAAKDVRETVDRDYPAASRPKLMGLPHAFQGSSWVTQPEHLGMALDSFFFNGWESTVAYFFPRGYDSRHWAAFAEATERAAKYEDIVRYGKRSDARVALEPVAGLYATPVMYPSGYLPELKDVPMLQQATYCWGDQNIVAVFNFWQKGEAFFTLKFAGLNATNNYAIVSESGVLRAKDVAHVTWTGAELATGVLLHVGAARTRVFEVRAVDASSVDASSVDAIVPIASAKKKTSSADADGTSASTSAATTILTDEAINKELESRRPILKRAAEKDAIYERGSQEKKGTSSDKDLMVI